MVAILETPPTIERNTDEELLYLGFGEEAYHNTDPMYEDGNRPTDRLHSLLQSSENRAARHQMMLNLALFEEGLQRAKKGEVDLAIEIKKIIRDLRINQARALKEPGQAKERFRQLKFLYNLGHNGGLFEHLDEAHGTASRFFTEIGPHLYSEKRGRLLTARQTYLMEFVAATHDLPKLLGDLNAQIDPDHEVIYQQIIGKYAEGHYFIASNGQKITLTAEDVQFITGVVGMHEDIWREETFAQQVSSFEHEIDPAIDLNEAIERGRMIFHFVDIFGNALEFNEHRELMIKDEAAFEARFIDLFRRHLQMPIKVEGGPKSQDWTRGKVFRPQWGLEGVAGLTHTFTALFEGWGIKINPTLIQKVEAGIAQVLNEALIAANEVLDHKSDTAYSYAIKNQQTYSPEELTSKKQTLETELRAKRDTILHVRAKMQTAA